jgi:hypothetical protein
MSAALENIAKVMREVQADCEADAAAVDRTPFTPKGVGATFGTTLAMLSVVARAVEVLAERIEA